MLNQKDWQEFEQLCDGEAAENAWLDGVKLALAYINGTLTKEQALTYIYKYSNWRDDEFPPLDQTDFELLYDRDEEEEEKRAGWQEVGRPAGFKEK